MMSENEALVERVARTLCCPSGVCGKEDSTFAICQAHTFVEDALRVVPIVLASLAPAPDREGLAQRQAREVMNPGFGSAVATGTGQSYGIATLTIKGDDTLSIRARNILVAQLEADGFEEVAGYVRDEQGTKIWAVSAIRAIERALSTG